MTKPRIAIIGAGLAGLSAAKELESRAEVTVFDKSRGVGGRLATRYADPYKFDHGAQYFTAKTDAFKTFIKPLEEKGLIARWNANFVEFDNGAIVQERQWDSNFPHYVGVPKMNEIGKYLAHDMDVKLGTQIAAIERGNDKWILKDSNDNEYPNFDWVIVATPSHQAVNILPQNFVHKVAVSNIKMQGCFTLMLGLSEPLELGWEAALVKNSNLSWVSVNSSKPNRSKEYSLVVHSSNYWADENIDADKTWVQEQMLAELSALIKQDIQPKLIHNVLHRWRYANVAKQETDGFLIDNTNKIAACGDWLVQGRVEAAFTSGHTLAKEISKML